MGPTGNAKVLQIHPTRRCNLRCLHCYSTSGPEERDELDGALLRAALTDARAEGYPVVSFSGGEPLVYKPLYELLEHAHQCGMLTSITTNGMLLNERQLARLRSTADLIAISLDGMPASHNRVRASERAFPEMAARLAGLRATGIPFGFIFTLTQYNLHELDWVANFALEQGARLLQIHPLEEVGRALELMPGERPDQLESAYAYVEFARLQAMVGARLHIHLDLTSRDYLRENPARVYADGAQVDPTARLLSDLISPLVIEADGTVVPIQHGFARAYALGNLREAPLSELAAHWRRERLGSFRELCQRVYQSTTAPTDLPFFNWYEVIGQMAAANPAS